MSTRWLSMKYVCIRILEWLLNLKEYFLEFLTKTKEFSNLKTSERYLRIYNQLKDDATEIYLSICAFCIEDFESLLTQFQFDQPMIHVLYDGMFNLLTNLMKKFIKQKHIFESAEKLKSSEDLFNVDISKTSNHKPLNLIKIGTKAKLPLSGCVLLEDEKEKNFQSECLQFYI